MFNCKYSLIIVHTQEPISAKTSWQDQLVKHQVLFHVHPSSLPLLFSAPEAAAAKLPQCQEDPCILPRRGAFPHQHPLERSLQQLSLCRSSRAAAVPAPAGPRHTSPGLQLAAAGRELSPVPPASDLAWHAPAMLRTRRWWKLNLGSVPVKDMATV